MKTDRTDMDLMTGFMAVCLAIIVVAAVVGIAFRIFRILAGL